MHTHKNRRPKSKIQESCKRKLGTIKERNPKLVDCINVYDIAQTHMKTNPMKWNKYEFKIRINKMILHYKYAFLNETNR